MFRESSTGVGDLASKDTSEEPVAETHEESVKWMVLSIHDIERSFFF
jgi:hypothetical protein